MTAPLAGIRVVECSMLGPAAITSALVDLGAEVIKVEPVAGDYIRQMTWPIVEGVSLMHLHLNRGKKSITLDLRSDEGKAVFRDLVKDADIVVEAMRPGALERLGIGPTDLRGRDPKLVFAKGHGQGQRGADAEAGGFDGVSFFARGGLAHLLTDPAAANPVGPRPALGDVPSGMFLAGGICAALVHVLRTGKGIVVDTSLLNGATWTLGPDMAYTSLAGHEPPRGGPSPIRNPMPRRLRFLVAVLAYGVAGPLGRVVARSAKVANPPFQWKFLKGPWFDNNLATLEVHGRGLRLWWATGVVEDGRHEEPRLVRVSEVNVD